ncbi:MAG: HAMP domain-containing sensor histidine kinase [Bryobacterales bacterium]
MKIRLVSRDRSVEKLCREGLAKFCGAAWDLYLDPDGRMEEAVDLSIVDLDALAEPYRKSEHSDRTVSILLYSEERLRAVRGPLPEATLLLKPLRRELFLTALGCAIEQQQTRESATQTGGQAGAPGSEGLLLQQVLGASLELQRFHNRQMHFLERGLHDLRAPLTAIEGYNGLLLAERFGPLTAMQRENLGRMQHSISRLSRMATDIFRLSLGERGEEGLDLQPGDLADRVQQALRELMPLAGGKQIRLSDDIAAPAGPLHFDGAQIDSVLTNLLGNACRFTPRHGSITVCGYSVFWDRRRTEVHEAVEQDRRSQNVPQPNAYRVDIRDSGPGVPAEHLDSIFEPYTSYCGSRDRAGAGLGLAICRMVISSHRGRIFAEPAEHGAVFSFLLPFAEQPARPERLQPQTESDHPNAAWRPGVTEETA